MSTRTLDTEPAVPRFDVHDGLHSHEGGLASEHSGRHRDPIIKVQDLAWLEFEKPDLRRTAIFAQDFGFTVTELTPDTLVLQGTKSTAPCLRIHRGPTSRFIGHTFQAAAEGDLERIARHADTVVKPYAGGKIVRLTDPSGLPVSVAYGQPVTRLSVALPAATLNFGELRPRINTPQRPVKQPARIERLGHVVLETNRFRAALDWYLETLGMIVSDFLFLDDMRDRGPTMAFLRCDRGSVPADHHTVAMHLGPRVGYVHSAYEVTDLDTVAMGGEYLKSRNYSRVWGIGRHIQGSQIFDYWRDPDHLMFEHFADGDLFDNSVEPGWARMSASGLSQWGPSVTKDFLGTAPTDIDFRSLVASIRTDTEIDVPVLRSLMKAMNS
ncbi:VOC family protein [Actinomycetes bacterium M1A6_2h]